ncbi:MAG: AAA family ATPase, partial [Oceanospirillaceae bacterium]|nr:AAA family ATPase [Oceanospirillaceae bacterium]
MTSSQSVMLTQAQGYADAGKYVFPVKVKSKQPANGNSFKGATISKEVIHNFWKDTAFNIGLATGEINNLVVVDVDDEQTWAKFVATQGGLPQGPKVITGKGHHLYFAYPKGRQIRNRQAPGNGFDIRANGGYVVAPPSIHHSGKVYRFTKSPELSELPELPEWLLELIAEPEKSANTTLNFTAPIPAASDSTPWAMAGLAGECQTIASTTEGSRNGNLNKGSFRVAQLVAGGELASHIAISALRQAGLQCGLPASEVEKTLKSGYQEGLHSPRVSGEATRPEGSSLDITKLIEAKPRLSALDQLSAYTANGRSAEMRQQMLDDKYVLDRIAIRGQWTTLYAAPNGGKTLLTLWMLIQQVKAGEIDGSKIYYVNADDHYKGQVEKLELLEPHKINVLLPNHNGFDTDKLTQLIGQLTKDKQAMGQVIILDTLKKFTDLMDKKASSEFGKLARTFVGAGGTIIALAHTNKNKDDEGKGVAGGTSDIMDDCDCAFLIEGRGPDGHNKYKAIFYNRKARGDV